MEHAVLAMLSLAHRADGWQPPVVKTVATDGRGIDELVDTIERCYLFFQKSANRAEKKREAARQRLITLLGERLINTAIQQVFPDGELNKLVEQIAERRQDPYSIVDEIIRNSQFQRFK
jgi:LAO/AO transport system kinase